MPDDNKIEYQHISENEASSERISDNVDNDHGRNVAQAPTNRPWIQTILLQALIVLWLVPIAALLWLNFNGWIIGASAWCPRGNCYRSLFSPDADQRAAKFDKNDHNVLGGLQLVAKALEMWWCAAAAAMLYIVTMAFASAREGLPLGYLTKPLHFSLPINSTSSLTWSTGPKSHVGRPAAAARYQYRLWFLIGLSLILFVLCSLMGPATAVLVIPTLQWIETEPYGTRRLTHVNGDLPPKNDVNSWFYQRTEYCDQTEYENFQFLCTYQPFGKSLDAWAQGYLGSGAKIPGMATQDWLGFELNATTSLDPNANVSNQGYIRWIPSRQIISNLSTDWLNLKAISLGQTQQQVKELNDYNDLIPDPFETYTDYNRSLSLELRRNGPVIGAISNMWLTYNGMRDQIIVQIDPYRQVRCYGGYNLYWSTGAQGTSEGVFTKCIRNGGGWNAVSNQWRSFYIDGRFDPETRQVGQRTEVRIMSSDKAVFLPNGEIPAGFDPDCLIPGQLRAGLDCDWDAFFTTAPEDPMFNRTQNMVTIEYQMGTSNSSYVILAVDFAAFLSMTDYVFDPSPIANPLRLVQTETLSKVVTNDTKPLFVDPTWVLAGWSANNDSTVWNRPMTDNMAVVLETLLSNRTLGFQNFPPNSDLDIVALLPIMNSLSLIDHSTIMEDPTSAVKGSEDEDYWQPMLTRHARIFVWSYSMKSRTSIFGAVIALLGCIVVLVQFVLGFIDRRPHRSPTQLLVAALEHSPRGEFEGKSHKERELAAARFRVQDDEHKAGKFSFYDPHV